MSWKYLPLLTAALGTGSAASAADVTVYRSITPPPHYAAAPRYAPPVAAPYYPPVVTTPYYPGVGPVRHLPVRDLERHVERTIRRHLGHCVDEVDVEYRRGCFEVEVELRHRHAYHEVYHLIHSMPELRGYHVHLKVERD